MKKTILAISVAGLLAATLFLSACATQIKTTATNNPPPGEAFSNFTAFELKPITLAPAFADSAPNQKALAKIQENLTSGMEPSLNTWNQTGATKTAPARTLLIEPEVAEIKFIGGAARFWVGGMAGSSAVIMRAKITEKETGKVIATPEFYEAAGAMQGGWSFGATDNMMLVNIARRLTDYLMGNYTNAVGGVTGSTGK